MRAVVFEAPGDASVLHLAEIPVPPQSPDEVRIRVRTTAVNRADILQRRGLYPPPAGASSILGLECAGTLQNGARVMALLAGGGYAEEVVVDARHCLEVPQSFNDAQAGGFMETFLTCYQNLFVHGGLLRGQRVLVHGGGSGIGTAATTLCHEAGAEVVVTCGSDDKCRRALAHGASLAVNYRTQDFAEATGKVDLVLDCVGAAYFEKNLAVLNPGGRLLLIGLQSGATVANASLAPILSKRLQIVGSTLRSRSAAEKAELIKSFRERFGAALPRLLPVVDRVFDVANAAAAHAYLESGAHFGKVVLAF